MSREKYKKLYNIWLVTNIVLITFMVVIGGYTRLTGSGLSITEWDLISGILPPLTQNDWYKIFSLYQQIPQYKEVNFYMNLNDFKQIFWLEYVHRLLGRLIGISTILPAIFFYFNKNATRKKKQKLILLSFLVILQGTIGWFMVSSGLSELTSVSHYRLALHLFTAFIIYVIFCIEWLQPRKIKETKSYFNTYLIFYILLIVQIIYGAFVAGLDAGYIYNSFPFMGDKIIANEIYHVTLAEFFLSNMATIQFIHRILAFLLVILALILICKGVLKNIIGKSLIILISLQFLLGVSTLLTIVNIHLAVLHQLFALLLFTNASIYMFKISKNELSR